MCRRGVPNIAAHVASDGTSSVSALEKSERSQGDFLTRLVAGGAITKLQVDWIEAIWPKLDDEAFAHPYLRTVREHTRAFLERAA
jgi:hypothetical protein